MGAARSVLERLWPPCRSAGARLHTASCASFSCGPQDVVVVIPPEGGALVLAPSLLGTRLVVDATKTQHLFRCLCGVDGAIPVALFLESPSVCSACSA